MVFGELMYIWGIDNATGKYLNIADEQVSCTVGAGNFRLNVFVKNHGVTGNTDGYVFAQVLDESGQVLAKNHRFLRDLEMEQIIGRSFDMPEHDFQPLLQIGHSDDGTSQNPEGSGIVWDRDIQLYITAIAGGVQQPESGIPVFFFVAIAVIMLALLMSR